MTTSPDNPANKPAHPPADTDCKCGHRKGRHELPYGPCKALFPSQNRCTCETYRPLTNPPADQTHCPTCGNPICHKCRHHRAAHRDPSNPPGTHTACQNEDCPCGEFEYPPAEPTYSITLHTDEYRGDHSAEIAIGIADKKNETIKDLFAGISQTTGRTIKPTDYLTIRVEVTDE